MERFPPGEYKFNITGSIAKDYSDYIVFDMILVEPLLCGTIELLEDNTFHDMTYKIEDPPKF